MTELEHTLPASPQAHDQIPANTHGDLGRSSARAPHGGSARNKIQTSSVASARMDPLGRLPSPQPEFLEPRVDAVRSAVRAELQDCLSGPMREVVRVEVAAVLQGWFGCSGEQAALRPAFSGREGERANDDKGVTPADPGNDAQVPRYNCDDSNIRMVEALHKVQGEDGDSLCDGDEDEDDQDGDNQDDLQVTVNQQSKSVSLKLRRLMWFLLKGMEEEPQRSGRLARFVDGMGFKLFIGAVIFVNIWFMVFEANIRIRTPSDRSLRAAEWVFFVIYCLELALKITVHRLFFFCRADWKTNVLDMLVCLSDAATLVLDATLRLSLMRVLRFLQFANVIRAFEIMYRLKYLQVFLVCIHGSLGSFLWSVIMLFSIYGIFSLFFMSVITTHIDATGEAIDDTAFGPLFGSVGLSIKTLFMVTTGGDDWNGTYRVIERAGPIASCVFLVFIAFVQLNLLNIRDDSPSATHSCMSRGAHHCHTCRLPRSRVPRATNLEHFAPVSDCSSLSRVAYNQSGRW
ncbi:unnamed protein product [Prorocentrum cordatum]|uniref:Ion transport domain-containing protein n=1 Tax=Prorocentrum cordatum TaxID=2364126 RepID=A0ABN9T5Y0_9DINO|nr:unnamed protein product [Polarella glacialis]